MRKIASGADLYTTVYSYSIRQIAGRHVLVGSTYSSQYAYFDLAERCTTCAAAARTRSPATARTSRGYPCGDPTVAPAAFVTLGGARRRRRAGRATASVMAFQPTGASRVLDSATGTDIPPASLRLTGNFATWTNAGVARSADLRTPG